MHRQNKRGRLLWFMVTALACAWYGAPAAWAFAPAEPDDGEEVRVGDDGVDAAVATDLADDDQAAGDASLAEVEPDAGDEDDVDEAMAADEDAASEASPTAEQDSEVQPASFNDAENADDALQPVATEAAPYDAQDSAGGTDENGQLMQPQRAATRSAAATAKPAVGNGPRGIAVEPARFKGLQPGVSSRAEAEQTLGDARRVVENNEQTECSYEVPPFERLTVIYQDDRMLSMVIDLKQAFPADMLAKELALDNIPAVTVLDDTGRPLGQSYPERGVLFSLAGEGPAGQVVQIILDSIDAQPFVVRAESTYREQLGLALADVDQALALDPQYGRAHWLRAEILILAGRPGEASQSAESALGVDPNDLEYRLTYATAVGAAGDHVQAIELLQSILAHTDAPGDLLARTRLHLGDQHVAGASRDYKQATEQHTQAIKLAEPLVNDAKLAVRRHARQVLLDGHLAVANDIAWGGWRSKTTVVPQWLERGNAIARKLGEDGDEAELSFRVAKAALAAMAGFQGRQEISGWLKDVRKSGQELIDAADDDLTRQRRQWELALAMYDALQIEHVRGKFDDALNHGREAAELFEASLAQREPKPGQDYMLGRLYFRLGSIEAIHHRDHPTAVTWFDKASPLIEQPIPDSSLGDLGRQGESLVSMAVSYWEVGRQDVAVRMTNDGVNLMVQAVNDGILEETALVVPYHNLSRMHRSLGDEESAQNFEQLASQSRASKRR